MHVYRKGRLVLPLLVVFGEPEGGRGFRGACGGSPGSERANGRSETTSRAQNFVRVAPNSIRGASGRSPGIRPAKRPQRNDVEGPKLRECCTRALENTTFDDSFAISTFSTEFDWKTAIFGVLKKKRPQNCVRVARPDLERPNGVDETQKTVKNGQTAAAWRAREFTGFAGLIRGSPAKRVRRGHSEPGNPRLSQDDGSMAKQTP